MYLRSRTTLSAARVSNQTVHNMDYFSRSNTEKKVRMWSGSLKTCQSHFEISDSETHRIRCVHFKKFLLAKLCSVFDECCERKADAHYISHSKAAICRCFQLCASCGWQQRDDVDHLL